MLVFVLLGSQAWCLVGRVVKRRRAEHLVEAEFKDWKENFNQKMYFSLLCLPLLRMTNVIPVSAGLGMAVITWKLSAYN